MLAMTFIAMLLVAIAMTTIQISNIYNKGITLREVNQAGRTVSEEFQRSIASSAPFDVTPKGDDSSVASTSKYVIRDGGGRLCISGYSYAWNYGSALAGGVGAPAIFNVYDDGKSSVSFAKVTDPNGSLCANPTDPVIRANAVELLTSGDRDLVLQSFSISRTANDATTGQTIYAISMIIGTNDRAQLTTDNASCKPPSEGAGNEQYCSVNQFDIIARAGNQSGGSQ